VSAVARLPSVDRERGDRRAARAGMTRSGRRGGRRWRRSRARGWCGAEMRQRCATNAAVMRHPCVAAAHRTGGPRHPDIHLCRSQAPLTPPPSPPGCPSGPTFPRRPTARPVPASRRGHGFPRSHGPTEHEVNGSWLKFRCRVDASPSPSRATCRVRARAGRDAQITKRTREPQESKNVTAEEARMEPP
jgi:hypothetical protein